MSEEPKLLAPEMALSDATQEVASAPESIEVGQWYWVNPDSEKDRWFGCVVHVGTNYAEVESPRRGTSRIHFDDFHETCKYESNPDRIIEGKIARYQAEVGRLLGRVKEVTAQLAIAPTPLLSGGATETQALALRGKDEPDMKAYGAALVKAKKETLPELFKEIESANDSMAVWMTAKVVPLKAQAKGLQKLIGAINDRIFSVELYAGLSEQVERIKDGKPAPMTEKIRLFQRRCYMDEECLARYETGGMEFENIGAFDAWFTREDNLKRLLPFPRCLVAFRVRRNNKVRELVNLIDLKEVIEREQADKITFLYIRNGEQVYRMNTAIEFDEKLFPDLERGQLTGKLWAKEFGGRIDGLITDNEHTGILEEEARKKREYEAQSKAYEAALKSPEAKAKAKAKGLKTPNSSCIDLSWPGNGWFDHDKYIPYDKSSVYFDDITKKIEKEIHKHNRIALILQGLLDRSPVLHPHPPWQIWTAEGFDTALELIHDETRALTSGDPPDFEAYRALLNASLKPGSVTVGQEDAWELTEAKKESDRRSRDSRHRGEHYRPSRFRPHGNPGPGTLAKLAEYSKSSGKCTYTWNRQRQSPGHFGEVVRTSFACVRKHILNVDAYTPGDFRTFFDDPRTRADYIQWAPLLLEAEEYHAGNRTASEPVPPEPKKESSYEGQRRYQQQKRRKYLLGKAVRITNVITTKGGTKYEVGTLWRVTGGEGGRFNISGINPDGSSENEPDYSKRRYVRGVSHYEFEVDPTVLRPKKASSFAAPGDRMNEDSEEEGE